MQKGANEKGSLCCLGHKETQWGSDWAAAFYHSASLSHTQIHTSSKSKLLLNYSCVNITSKHTQHKFHFTVLSHTQAHTLLLSVNPHIHFILGLTDLCLLNLSATWMEETGWRETPCQSLWNTLSLTIGGKKTNLTEKNCSEIMSDPHIHDVFKSHIRKSFMWKWCLLFFFLLAWVQTAFAIHGCKRITDVPQLLNRNTLQTHQRASECPPHGDILEFKRRPVHSGTREETPRPH